ncbi:MAG TPA: bifunctional phosphopantothenoylcysteine decarboxylase/phosphopantothenate--cysteine ligase CoaBC [Candidatus Nanoarchaeia archaeon]|nr:bifunctional phosphopantothenoylcysteine decarboxylase/phosphopantothenate--cysteine ligase CoaBC [Candidatus Nanoarchaeia archaeon]
MNIVIGVTSGIACYKVLDLVKKLKGHSIHVIMTEHANHLISPKEFEKATKNPVVTDLFNKKINYKAYLKNNKEMRHISLADIADVFVIAPATADIIGKIANGIADDLLTTTIMATKALVLICPSMNAHMWQNPIVQENVRKLRNLHYHFINPESGMLACGYRGVGRLAHVDAIAEKIELLLRKKDLRGKKILVTAGPTQEPVDPVRVITNRSSGKMGYAVAEAAAARGAKVTLISGPTNLEAPADVKIIDIETAEEMKDAILKKYEKTDVVIMAAAVADFKVKQSKQKIKKDKPFFLKLERNFDILHELGKKKKKQKLIGFALETKDLVTNAVKKLKEKNLDMIIANSQKSLQADRADFLLINNRFKKRFINISKQDMANKMLDELT